MPTLKKARSKVTYRIVNRPRDDPEYHEGNETMWVSEEELHPNRHRATTNVNGQLVGLGGSSGDGGSAGLTAEDLAYFAANGYGQDSEATGAGQGGRRRVHFEDPNADGLGDEDYYDEEDGEYYGEDEDGDWLDEAEEVTDERALMGGAGGGKRARSGNDVLALIDHEDGVDGEDGDDDDRLFEDEVECEVTDDFLRQLVMGSGGAGNDGGEDDDDGYDDGFEGMERNEDVADDAAAFDAMMEAEDGEMWRLLTEEERQAIRETHLRGTARRRRRRADANDVLPGEGLGEGEDAYPRHDVTRRALERQFDAMLREFDGDEAVNDAYTDDPRTHGPLSMDKYLTALQEFVVDRAGVDLETAEPRKNKGLITQLKLMSHRAGAFDTDQKGGVFVTTLLPDKQNRFVAEYRTETDEIRRQARLRVFKKMLLDKLQAHAADAIVSGEPEPAKMAEFAKLQAMLKKVESEENKLYTVPDSALVGDADVEKEVKTLVEQEMQKREGRMDCETAVSTFSTYYNQPNILKAPTDKRTEAARRARVNAAKAKRAAAARLANSDVDDDGEGTEEASNAGTAAPLVFERRKDETPEERKARRQAVKAAQRARRQEKSALKQAYKNVEKDELHRVAQSNNARRTVKFA